MKRRDFIIAAMGSAVASGCSGGMQRFSRGDIRSDVSYEPDQALESTGLSITDGLKILKKGEAGNTAPVLREEILDNPHAVFIIRTGVSGRMHPDGSWDSANDQMEDLGNRVGRMVFRRGTERGGRTFIKPNMVGGGTKKTFVNGHLVHPYFTCGLVDELRGIGNSNVAISARGALRHPQVVESGMDALFKKHNLPFIEAHVQYFKHYNKKDLLWHENPDGMVTRRYCTYKPACLPDTRYINIAHAHTHKVGHTTLTLKNNQGIMPRGYGHICDAWTTLDLWRRQFMDDFNRDYRKAIEESYVRHARMGYKYWDDGGYYKAYRAAGGYDRFQEAYRKYEKAGRDKVKRQEMTDLMVDLADTRLFWAEIWAQRMMDIVEVMPKPYVNMVEGVFGRGDRSGIVNSDFVTVGRDMVTVDAVTSWLMGQDPRELPYLRIANERGIGQNDIEKIDIYMLSDKGVEKVNDYRYLRRDPMGIYNLGLREPGLRFF